MDKTLGSFSPACANSDPGFRRETERSLKQAFVVSFFFGTYRYIIGPAIHALGGAGFGCRFEPSCSRYAEDAFRLHSPIKAFGLTVRRLLRCHPWSRRDVWDPVPSLVHRLERTS